MRASVALLVVAVAGCDGPFVPPPLPPPPPARVAAVAITPDSDTVVARDSLLLAVTLRDSAGAPLGGRTVAWSSDDADVAYVTQDGWVYAQDSGVTRIRATADSASGAAVIGVVPRRLLVAAAGGRHTCAVANDGDVLCWGANAAGQAGDTSGALQLDLPGIAAAGGAFRAVSAGGAHTCALAADGSAWCWGDNGSGQLGRGSLGGGSASPAPVASTLRFSAVAAGGTFTCGITATGGVACWGADGSAPATVSDAAPHATAIEASATAVAAGGGHACTIVAGGAALCWGAGGDGQLGDGDSTASATPVPVTGVPGLAAVAAGGAHSCGVDSAGAGWCWGKNDRGQTGTGLAATNVYTPDTVAGGLRFRTVVAGGQFSCGLTVDSLAYCWGANDAGQLGDSTLTDRDTPAPVAGAHRFATLTAGARHACGVTADHAAWCWGYGLDGELGRPTAASSDFPVPVILP